MRILRKVIRIVSNRVVGSVFDFVFFGVVRILVDEVLDFFFLFWFSLMILGKLLVLVFKIVKWGFYGIL